MSHEGSPRSRSPPAGKVKPSKATLTGAEGASDDTETLSDQLWDDICPRLDVKLDGFKDDVKKVVNSLVGKQVERLEESSTTNKQ